MSRKILLAAFVAGNRNMTRVTPGYEANTLSNEDLAFEALARQVAAKEPGRLYQIYEVRDGAHGLRRVGDVLATWHVGEGFEHADGWWVE